MVANGGLPPEIAAAMQQQIAMLKGDSNRLTVTVNHPQSTKVELLSGSSNKMMPPPGDAIPIAAKRVHRLVFPTYSSLEETLPWLDH